MIAGHLSLISKDSALFESIRPAHPAHIGLVRVGSSSGLSCFIYEKNRTDDPFKAYEGQILSPEEDMRLKKCLLEWPLQSILITCDAGDQPCINILRNVNASCPLYVFHQGTTLFLHWDPVELYPLLNKTDMLDRLECIRFLNGQWDYGYQTVFKNIFLLPERSQAFFSPSGFRMMPPPEIAGFEAGVLKQGVDPIGRFYDLLCQAILRWSFASDKVFTELSSGLDSSLVTYALAQIASTHPLHTFGYSPLGNDREAILNRRAETVQKLKTQDHCLPMEDFFSAAFSPHEQHWPYQAPTAFEKTRFAKIIAHNGGDLVFTGVGGDELCMLSQSEKALFQKPNYVKKSPASHVSTLVPDSLIALTSKQAQPSVWPVGLVPASCADIGNSTAVHYLRQGVWQAHPLASVEIQSFAHFLPIEWRRDRYLSRAILERLGASSSFLRQDPKENLTASLDALVLHGDFIKAIFSESYLVDIGLLDPTKIAWAIEALKAQRDSRAGFLLLLALSLEASLKSAHRVCM